MCEYESQILNTTMSGAYYKPIIVKYRFTQGIGDCDRTHVGHTKVFSSLHEEEPRTNQIKCKQCNQNPNLGLDNAQISADERNRNSPPEEMTLYELTSQFVW